MVEVFVRAMDKETGLGQVKVGDTPIASLDTQPGDWAQVSMATVGSGGSIDKTVTATDKVGNSKELRIRYENRRTNCGGGLHGPGNDHPDDNLSAASAQAAAYSLPAGARSEPRVAVLGSGFNWATA